MWKIAVTIVEMNGVKNLVARAGLTVNFPPVNMAVYRSPPSLGLGGIGDIKRVLRVAGFGEA